MLTENNKTVHFTNYILIIQTNEGGTGESFMSY